MAAGAVGFIERLAADQNVLRRELAGELREPAAPAASALPAGLACAALTLIRAAAGGGLGWRLSDGSLALRRGGPRALREHKGSRAGGRKNGGGYPPGLCSHSVSEASMIVIVGRDQRGRAVP